MVIANKWVIALGVAMTSTATAHAENFAGVFKGAQLAPVYLYEDAHHNVLTYDVSSIGRGTLSALRVRHVDSDEIAMLREAGLQVRFIQKPTATAIGQDVPGTDDPIIPELESLPENFTIVQLNGAQYGSFFVATDQPTGAAQQWLRFFFSSFNMEEFGSHMAIGLLLDWRQLTETYPPAFVPQVVGNGMIIGNVSGTPNGCGFDQNQDPAYNMEVESFWNGGNMLYSQTCAPDGLADKQLDYINLAADVSGTVFYDVVGGTTWFPPDIETAVDRPSGSAGTLSGGGIVFALVPTPSAPPAVAVTFLGAKTGWSEDSARQN